MTKKLPIILILIAYIIVLTYHIMIKHPTMAEHILNNWSYESMLRHFQMYTNFTPFKTILNSFDYPPTFRIMVYNVIAFIPLGFLVPMLLKNRRYQLMLTLISGLFLSLSYEFLQLLTRLGSGDIDDVILNVFGTMIGYQIFLNANKAYQKVRYFLYES